MALAELRRQPHEAGTPPRRASPARDRPQLPRAAARLGAHLLRQDPGAVHRLAGGERAALALRPGARLADRRVLAPSGLDGRADAARSALRSPAGPDGRDPAADRPLGARRRRHARRSASGRSGSTATSFRRTAARAAPLSPASTSPPCSRSTSFGLSKALTGSVAAVSVGVVDGQALLDLDYEEDSGAEVDVNVVTTGAGELIEVQATAERVTFSRDRLDELLDLAAGGIEQITLAQHDALAGLSGVLRLASSNANKARRARARASRLAGRARRRGDIRPRRGRPTTRTR